MRRIWRRAQPKPEKRFRINEQIKIPKVFLIDENGENVGVVDTQKALDMAREAGFDLVEVNPKAYPSVVKIMDYGQFKYEKDKQVQKQKTKQKKTETKGIRLSVRISKHDFDFRVEQAKKFLAKGNKLKLELLLKGRERQHPGKAVEIINSFTDALRQVEGLNIDVEQDLTKMGGKFSIILINKGQ
ncbi:MAG: translation initiation factor IF-3 [bacterium]|nr:translation initiation factor IF-3 [bacterium]